MTVIELGKHTHRAKPSAKTSILGNDGVQWALPKIATDRPQDWVTEVMRGKPYEHKAETIFVMNPSLRFAADQLANFITPYWPTQSGESLLEKTLDSAVNATMHEIGHGDHRTGRIIGVFLYHLTSCAKDIAKIRIYGRNSAGVVRYWQHLEQPLLDWARQHGMLTIEAQLSDDTSNDVRIDGLRTYLLGRIAQTADDAGCMTSYAPRG